jgi:hypothetical protein
MTLPTLTDAVNHKYDQSRFIRVAGISDKKISDATVKKYIRLMKTLGISLTVAQAKAGLMFVRRNM